MKFAALVTACLQILLRRSAQADLHPPLFLVSPKYDFYITGMFVNLTCSAPENIRMSRILFGRDQWLLYDYRPPSPLASFTYTRRLSPHDGGAHFCTYRAAESRQNISSPESSRIRILMMGKTFSYPLSITGHHNDISVTRDTPKPTGKTFTYHLSVSRHHNDISVTHDTPKPTGSQVDSPAPPPPAPNLSVSPPYSIFVQGEPVRLNCLLPEGRRAMDFSFHERTEAGSWSWYKPQRENSLVVLSTQREPPKTFACSYREENREEPSPTSNHVVVSITDLPPPPVLTVDPPSGVANEGGFLRLTCSAIGSNAEQRFRFYKDGIQIFSSSEESLTDSREPRNASSNVSLSILIQVMGPNHTGEFACRYEQKLSSRWINSPWSQMVNVTAQLPNLSPPSMGYAWWASLLPVPMALFVYYCWRKKGVLFALCTSKYQHKYGPKESKLETSQDRLGSSVPQMTAFQLKSSDVTYATIVFPPAVTPSEPTMEDGLILAKEEEVISSDFLLHSSTKPSRDCAGERGPRRGTDTSHE